MRERWLAALVALPFVMGAAAAPSHPGKVAFTFHDPAIVESSGLVATRGLVVTANDSGDDGRVFAVDPATGRTVGVTHWSDDPVDVEALAPAGPGQVWVGDVGDNTGSRDSVQVARVPVGRGERSVRPPVFDLVYPDGPVDAEALLTDPHSGRLYVATKNVFGGHLYAAPGRLDADRPNRLRELGTVQPIVTDGAFWPDGHHLVLRDYRRAVVYTFPGLEQVGSFDLPDQDQGEGLAVDADGSLLLSSEGQREPVLRVALPAGLRRALAAGASTSGTSSAEPSGTPAAADGAGSERPPSSTAGDDVTWPWLLAGVVAVGALTGAAVVVQLASARRGRGSHPHG